MPRPTKILNSGPANDAVMAMFPNPFRAIAIFVEKSPTEFPQAITVKPSMALLIPDTEPMNVTRLTNSLAIKLIHKAARQKLYTETKANPIGKDVPIFHFGGWSVRQHMVVAKNQIVEPKIAGIEWLYGMCLKLPE
mmetsp:Transcript_13632/g.34305  ORF Transcript_13632/g.34305 Transcript_13632/m.34305 type:complete len:136 (-) Transcript_13632:333-740(-)